MGMSDVRGPLHQPSTPVRGVRALADAVGGGRPQHVPDRRPQAEDAGLACRPPPSHPLNPLDDPDAGPLFDEEPCDQPAEDLPPPPLEEGAPTPVLYVESDTIVFTAESTAQCWLGWS